MKRHLAAVAVAVAVIFLPGATALAAERTVTLAVQNMYCSSCPYIVKKALTAVPGVDNVKVSLEKKTAVVTFDDAKTNIEALTSATANSGYPSTLARDQSARR